MDMDDLAIITVSYNSSSQLGAFLTSVRATCGSHPTILIADNASRDVDVTRTIAGRFGARVVSLPENVGYGRAVNAAVSDLAARFTEILIANPDVTFSDSAVTALVSRLRAEPDAAAVGPQILNADGTTYPSARAVPSLATGTMHALLHGIWPTNPWSVQYRNDTAEQVVLRDVGWLSGACLLVRRSAFESIGGFSSEYFMYFEDVDLGVRLGRAGWRNVYDPNATVTHVGGESTKVESDSMIRAHHRSAATFVARTHPRWFELPVRVGVRAGLAVRQRLQLRQARRARAASSE